MTDHDMSQDNALPPDLTIIVPAFNEAENLTPVIDETMATVGRWRGGTLKAEVVIVDDGSVDGTEDVCASLTARYPALKVIRHQTNRGFGAALRTGFKAATGEYSTFIPADGEIRVDQALGLFELSQGGDLVTSKRVPYHDPRIVAKVRPWWREFMSKGYAMLCRQILGFDPSRRDGIFVIRTKEVQNFKLRSTTGAIVTEILMSSLMGGAVNYEGEISYNLRLSGKSKVINVKTIVRHLRDIIILRARLD